MSGGIQEPPIKCVSWCAPSLGDEFPSSPKNGSLESCGSNLKVSLAHGQMEAQPKVLGCSLHPPSHAEIGGVAGKTSSKVNVETHSKRRRSLASSRHYDATP